MNDDKNQNEAADDRNLDARIKNMLGSARDAAPTAPQVDLDPDVVSLRPQRNLSTRSTGRGWTLAALAAVGVAAAVAAAVVVMNDDTGESLRPTPATEPQAPTSTTAPTTVPDSTPDSSPEPAPGTSTSPWFGVGVSSDGIVRMYPDGSIGRPLAPECNCGDDLEVIFDTDQGESLIGQRHVGPSTDGAWTPEDTAIVQYAGSGGFAPVPLEQAEGTWLRLHDVGTVGGHSVILYEEMRTPDPLGPDAGRLLLHDNETGETTVVDDDFGGWERSSNLFQVSDNGLVVGEKQEDVTTTPTIYRVLDDAPDITPETLGLQPSYSECTIECPTKLTVDPTGTVFAYAERGGLAWTDGESLHFTSIYGSDPIGQVSQVFVVADAIAAIGLPGEVVGSQTSPNARIFSLTGEEFTSPGPFVSLYSSTPAPTVTNELDPSDIDGSVLVDQRVVTAEDLARLPDGRNVTQPQMYCSDPQSDYEEYDVGFSPSENGADLSVKATGAIASINYSLVDLLSQELPTTGWTMLVDGSKRWFVLPDESGDWVAVIYEYGKPWVDAWRHSESWYCVGTGATTTTTTTEPGSQASQAFTGPEDGMFAVTNALGDALTYPSAQKAADALVAALSRPDGCEVAPTARSLDLGEDGAAHDYRIEYRFGCDDTGGGFDLEVRVARDDATSTWVISAATLQTYCLRGVTPDGLCI